MAIKTKKITDLATLSNISTTNTFFLGVDNDVTGKIKYADILDDVREIVNGTVQSTVPTAIAEIASTNDDSSTSSLEDFVRLENYVNNMKKDLSDVIASYKELNKKYESYAVSTADTILSLQSQIATQNEKIDSLEGFVQALQKDGYLTLAEIRKAAAEACPICTHTHEEPAE